MSEFQSYKGVLPVLILDNDMHKICRACAKYFPSSELNPADSHGVFGEYWQNRGPGTEEKLALTTGGLLTQHHIVNPFVLDMSHYFALSSCPYKEYKEMKQKEKEKEKEKKDNKENKDSKDNKDGKQEQEDKTEKKRYEDRK